MLFDAKAPAYFRRKLNEETERFIIEEAVALPLHEPINLKVLVPESEFARGAEITDAICQHFANRRKKSEKQLKDVMKLGWSSLVIGIGFVGLILVLTQIGSQILPKGRLEITIRESLIIIGWVALWRPAELLLYEWRPFKSEAILFGRLQECNVRVIEEKS